MGVIRKSTIHQPSQMFHHDTLTKEECCFFCGENIWRAEPNTEEVITYWAGFDPDGTGKIYLHDDCAQTFALHLIGDSNAAMNFNKTGDCVLPAHKGLKD